MSNKEQSELEHLRLADDEHWLEGPPHEAFRRLREECPVHWSSGLSQYPRDAGFWSVTKADDVHTVSRDWETYSSASNIILADTAVPVELVQRMFIGMDPPKHDRIKMLFQRGLHAEGDRRPRGRDPGDHRRRHEPPRRSRYL